jgi:hypothetical protein
MPFVLQAQINKMKDILEDVQTEQNDGKFTLRFFDALTGVGVDDARVEIINQGEFVTDAAGRVLFDMLPEGIYYFKFSKKGYIAAQYKFEVVANTIFYNRFSVSPRTELGAVRIVLDWDQSPSDLDLHLIKEHAYHISYRNKINSGDGAAQLDRDDTDSYGPETITINKTDNEAVYYCSVVDYTNIARNNTNALSKSKAVVRVYNNNELADTFYVPLSGNGNNWQVFKISKGNITGIYQIQTITQ